MNAYASRSVLRRRAVAEPTNTPAESLARGAVDASPPAGATGDPALHNADEELAAVVEGRAAEGVS